MSQGSGEFKLNMVARDFINEQKHRVMGVCDSNNYTAQQRLDKVQLFVSCLTREDKDILLLDFRNNFTNKQKEYLFKLTTDFIKQHFLTPKDSELNENGIIASPQQESVPDENVIIASPQQESVGFQEQGQKIFAIPDDVFLDKKNKYCLSLIYNVGPAGKFIVDQIYRLDKQMNTNKHDINKSQMKLDNLINIVNQITLKASQEKMTNSATNNLIITALHDSNSDLYKALNMQRHSWFFGRLGNSTMIKDIKKELSKLKSADTRSAESKGANCISPVSDEEEIEKIKEYAAEFINTCFSSISALLDDENVLDVTKIVYKQKLWEEITKFLPILMKKLRVHDVLSWIEDDVNVFIKQKVAEFITKIVIEKSKLHQYKEELKELQTTDLFSLPDDVNNMTLQNEFYLVALSNVGHAGEVMVDKIRELDKRIAKINKNNDPTISRHKLDDIMREVKRIAEDVNNSNKNYGFKLDLKDVNSIINRELQDSNSRLYKALNMQRHVSVFGRLGVSTTMKNIKNGLAALKKLESHQSDDNVATSSLTTDQSQKKK